MYKTTGFAYKFLTFLALFMLAGLAAAQPVTQTITIPNGTMTLTNTKCTNETILGHVSLARILDDQWYSGYAEYTESGATQVTKEEVCWHVHPNVAGGAVSVDKDGYIYKFMLISLPKDLSKGRKAI